MKKILLIIALSVSCCMPVWASAASTIVVMDAGSTGTRLHAFLDQRQAIVETINIKRKPGLASFVKGAPGDQSVDAVALKAYLTALIDQARAQGLQNDASLHVYATAGLRLLAAPMQQALMQTVRQDLHDMGFTQVKAVVITGQQEAVYGWLSANHDNLYQHPSRPTHGVVDLGGASMEVAFETGRKNVRDAADRVKVRIRGRDHTLLAKSYLGLGKDQALVAIDGIRPESRAACFADGTLSTPSDFNWNRCRESVTPVFSHVTSQSKAQLVRRDRWVPKQFVAMGALYFTSQFLKGAPQAQWAGVTQGICHRSWSSLQGLYPHALEQYLKVDCMAAVYGDAVLAFLNVKRGKTVAFANFDWAKGAAMAAFSGETMPG